MLFQPPGPRPPQSHVALFNLPSTTSKIMFLVHSLQMLFLVTIKSRLPTDLPHLILYSYYIWLNLFSSWINVREYRKGNQQWTIQINREYIRHRRRTQTHQKRHTVCVGHHHTQDRRQRQTKQKFTTQCARHHSSQTNTTLCARHNSSLTNTNYVNKTRIYIKYYILGVN